MRWPQDMNVSALNKTYNQKQSNHKNHATSKQKTRRKKSQHTKPTN